MILQTGDPCTCRSSCVCPVLYDVLRSFGSADGNVLRPLTLPCNQVITQRAVFYSQISDCSIRRSGTSAAPSFDMFHVSCSPILRRLCILGSFTYLDSVPKGKIDSCRFAWTESLRSKNWCKPRIQQYVLPACSDKNTSPQFSRLDDSVPFLEEAVNDEAAWSSNVTL